MEDLNFRYSIRSQLPGHPKHADALGKNFIETLDALTRIDSSIFLNWEIMDFPAKASVPLAAARPCIGGLIQNNVTRDDQGRPDPHYGYGAVAFTGGVAASRHINLRIRAGGAADGDTLLEIGYWKTPADPAIISYSLFKTVMMTINGIWPPSWACANAFRMSYDKAPLFPGAPLFPYSRFHIPWIAYLSGPLAAGIVLQQSDITIERTVDGGLLMTATKERLDPADPEHVGRARILAETLIERIGIRS